MGRETGIAWTDSTFNGWIGCTEVSPGCDNCYAREVDAKFAVNGITHWGKGVARQVLSDKYWSQLGTWQRAAARENRLHKVFTFSMGDIMDDDAPEGQLQRLYDAINASPNLVFQFLTKRPHRYADRLPAEGFRHKNVWLGATMENQHFYDIRWPILHRVASALGLVSWVSYEPALGLITMRGHVAKPDWIVFGGETGKDDVRRPMDIGWAERISEECKEFDVAFFMKQMSARNPKKAAELIPVDMLIRDYPKEAPRD